MRQENRGREEEKDANLKPKPYIETQRDCTSSERESTQAAEVAIIPNPPDKGSQQSEASLACGRVT